jgi:hypothetical protein
MTSFMHKILKATLFFIVGFVFVTVGRAQTSVANETTPEIFYASPREYKIAGITVTGVDNYERRLMGLSG